MMNLRNVEAFIAVSEAGSFTLAAHRLRKTQSAVSQAVRQLEEELGVVLIDRASRKVTLTPAGAVLRNLSAYLFDDLARIASLVREHAHARLRELRIAMVDTFAAAVGPELIRSMLDEATHLTLWSDLTPRLRSALLAKQVDIVVANDSFDSESRLTRHELLREPYVLLLPASLEAQFGNRPDLNRLARAVPMIRYRAPSHMGAQIDAACHRLGVMPARRIVVDSTEKLTAMVAAGIGWSSSTPVSLLRASSHIGAIRVLPFPGEPLERRMYMLARRGEFDDLLARLAATARAALAALIEDGLGSIAPDCADRIVIGATDAPSAG
jgi:DNA-binding transcriptional LysR family regulator